jgi:hypothetical protein
MNQDDMLVQVVEVRLKQSNSKSQVTPPSPFIPQRTETNRLSLDSAAIPK